MVKKSLDRRIVSTDDGSHTLFIPELNEHYHSTHGAIQEAMHVYINNGLKQFADLPELNILEIGFGTGLNALLTCLEVSKTNQKTNYTSIEKYPLLTEEVANLNYANEISKEANLMYKKIHEVKWESFSEINSLFRIKKIEVGLSGFTTMDKYNLIYFDAFGPEVQPKLWTEEIFKQMYDCLLPGGVLATYSAKGVVKQSMRKAGFIVKRLKGPPGKWHMLRCKK